MSHAESARNIFKELNVIIDGAKRDIANVGFSDRIDGLVEDEAVFVELTINSLQKSFEKALEKMIPVHEEDIQVPDISEIDDVEEDWEINTEELIAESYNVGKTDEEKSQAIMDDLKEVFKMYAYLFISIGQQLEVEKLSAKNKGNKNVRQNLSPRNQVHQSRS